MARGCDGARAAARRPRGRVTAARACAGGNCWDSPRFASGLSVAITGVGARTMHPSPGLSALDPGLEPTSSGFDGIGRSSNAQAVRPPAGWAQRARRVGAARRCRGDGLGGWASELTLGRIHQLAFSRTEPSLTGGEAPSAMAASPSAVATVVSSCRLLEPTVRRLVAHGLRVVEPRDTCPTSEPRAGDRVTGSATAGIKRLAATLAGERAAGLLAFMPDVVDDSLLRAVPALEAVACAMKGTDNIDVGACASRGVQVWREEDALTEPTAELALSLALAALRRLPEGDARVRGGDFRGWRPELYGGTLHGAHVGIFGMGAVGSAVARRVAPFLPTAIHYVDPDEASAAAAPPNAQRLGSASELLAACDVTLLCAPLHSGTRGAVGARALSGVRPGAALVNVARGGLVDEAAVADALEAGALGVYAADVFDFEDRIGRGGCGGGVNETLASMPPGRAIFTPHLGSATRRARLEIEANAADALAAMLAGRPPPAGRVLTP